MKNAFDKLNLRPGERRLVVVVGIVIFLVLNVLFVFPMFGTYATTEKAIKDSKLKLGRYQAEVKRKPEYERSLRDLETKGVFVGQEDQALQLQNDVGSQASLSGVYVSRFDPSPRGSSGKTNAFFDESSLVISLSTGEKELIDFLYNLGSSRSSLIRVRSMTLGPEPNRMKLQGSMTLVESFQRKPPTVTRASAPPPKAATNKPAIKPPVTTTAPPKKEAVNAKTNQVRKPIPPK